MFKELKESMSKKLKESTRVVSHQVENVNKEKESTKWNQTEILDVKVTIIKMETHYMSSTVHLSI